MIIEKTIINAESLITKKFGCQTLLSLAIAKDSKRNRVYFNCICDCGWKSILRLDYLKNIPKKCRFCNIDFYSLNLDPLKEASAFNEIFGHYRGGAKARGLEFSLTKSDFKNITSKNCDYCNCKPALRLSRNGKSSYVCNGVDRIDSTKGYVLDNCVPCCTKCNLMKLDLSLEEFKAHIDLLYYNLHN
jgi:hypothetical protein